MKKSIKNLLSILALLVFATQGKTQDVHFSQFYETPLFRNPALAGIVNGDYRAQAVYRSQWNSVVKAYKTVSANVEYKMPIGNGDNFATIGLQTYFDQAGTSNLNTTQILPALNFHKLISNTRNTYLSLGFMGGMVQRKFDRSKVTTNNTFDNGSDGEPIVNSGYRYFDGSVGMSFNTEVGQKDNKIILGVAYHHFNRPASTFFINSGIELDPKLVITGDMKFELEELRTLTFHADHVMQGSSTETTAGLLYSMKFGPDYDKPDYSIAAGGFIRWNDALIPTVQVGTGSITIGLSYDVNISKLGKTSYGNGGFELSLTHIGFTNRDNSSLNAMRCPTF